MPWLPSGSAKVGVSKLEEMFIRGCSNYRWSLKCEGL